jgi:hypothetical protein
LLLINISATDADNDTITYGTNATNGTLDAATGNYSWLTTSADAGTYSWYFNSSDNYGGVASETITVTVTSAPIFNYIPPIPVNLTSTQGNFWINYTWQPGTGNVTDSYNVSQNGIWINGTTSTSNNSTIVPHGWSNITVYAYYNSGTGQLNLTPATMNTQLANNVPVLSPIGNKTVLAGNWLNFTISATDPDNDTITFGTNAANGTLNATTGNYSWQTNSIDIGTYFWYFNSSDNYGGIAIENVTVSVN